MYFSGFLTAAVLVLLANKALALGGCAPGSVDCSPSRAARAIAIKARQDEGDDYAEENCRLSGPGTYFDTSTSTCICPSGTCKCTSDSTLEFYGPYTYCGCIDNSKVFTDGIGCRSCPAPASTDYTQIDDMCFCPNGMTFNTAVWQCPCDDTTQIRDSTGTCVACTDGSQSDGNGSCTCSTASATFNLVTNTCDCPANTFSTGGGCTACGGNLESPAASTSIDQCTCVAGSDNYNAEYNVCSCDGADYYSFGPNIDCTICPATTTQTAINVGSCQCPGLQTFDTYSGTCSCNAPDECQCLPGSTITYSMTAQDYQLGRGASCVCDSGNELYVFGAGCVACPLGSTFTTDEYSGFSTCVCNDPSATFDYPSSCQCGAGLALSDQGYCGCPANSYGQYDEYGNLNCDACGTNTVSPIGSTDVSQCVCVSATFVDPNNAGACLPCGTGTDPTANGCVCLESSQSLDVNNDCQSPCPANTFGSGGDCTACPFLAASPSGSLEQSDCVCSYGSYRFNYDQDSGYSTCYCAYPLRTYSTGCLACPSDSTQGVLGSGIDCVCNDTNAAFDDTTNLCVSNIAPTGSQGASIPTRKAKRAQALFLQSLKTTPWHELSNDVLCPNGETACPVLPSMASYECIDTSSELESCGGCQSLGQGIDCLAVTGVLSATCVAGLCETLSCTRGWDFKASDSSSPSECVQRRPGARKVFGGK